MAFIMLAVKLFKLEFFPLKSQLLEAGDCMRVWFKKKKGVFRCYNCRGKLKYQFAMESSQTVNLSSLELSSILQVFYSLDQLVKDADNNSCWIDFCSLLSQKKNSKWHEYSSAHLKSAGFNFTSHINDQPGCLAERECRGTDNSKTHWKQGNA